MDFVRFYIVQLVKNAASRIKLIDKEKEKLLSGLVARIENSRDLFPDLKMMERVVELEETASKLISIYRRLNKSHIDLEKISYQFANDRDAVQSTLRRFLQGNFRNGIFQKRRPKIVFDDTTLTIYELNEPQETEVEETTPQVTEPKIDLVEFLRIKDEEIVTIKNDTVLDKTENKNIDEKFEFTSDTIQNQSNNKFSEVRLDIDNGVVKKSLESSVKENETDDRKDDLVLPLEFEWKQEERNGTTVEKEDEQIEHIDKVTEISNQEVEKQENDEFIVERENNVETQNEKEVTVSNQTTSSNSGSNDSDLEIEDESEPTVFDEDSNEIMSSIKSENDNLYLDFEKTVLENILEVDDLLNKILNDKVDDDSQLKIMQRAYQSYQLAKELQFDLISELIKVYWLALVAITDKKLDSTKQTAELIRSTLVILVTLIKQREIDLEPFMQKHNKLKEILKSIDYEV